MKVNDLFIIEARKTKIQTQTIDDPFLRAFGNVPGAEQHPLEPVKPQQQQRPEPQRREPNRLRQAGAERTRQRTANVELPAGAEDKLAAIHDLDLDDQMSDEDAARHAGVTDGEQPEPQQPGTALATITTAIARAGEVQPEWHQVKHLPGYMSRPIRSLGRQVFGTMTNTPIENIQVLADLGQSGNPNTSQEINAVAAWLKKNGTRDTDGEMNFQNSIPDYKAEFFIYKAQGMTFMLVKDFAGQYIYSWPSSDEKALKGPKERVTSQLPRRLH